MSVVACPACSSTDLKAYPTSRRTQRRTFRCRGCGLVGWTDRDELVMPDTVGLDDISVEDREAWVASKRGHVVEVAQVEVLDRLATLLEGAPGRSVYDIGAGDGQFLSVAAAHGFDVRGNDLIEANVHLAQRQYEIGLDLGDLTTLDVPAQDAVTMWCVLAHVEEPAGLLRSSFDVLKPGGRLFLQTPRRTRIDTAAMAVSKAARGRMTRWVDRRIAPHHWHLHTAESMTAALEAVGFVDVEVIPKARYSLNSGSYLRSLGVPARAATSLGNATDRLIDRGWAPRIVLEAYARKPGVLEPARSAATRVESSGSDQAPSADPGLSAAG